MISVLRAIGAEIGVQLIEIKLGHSCTPLLGSTQMAFADDRAAYHELRQMPS
jgi:hypothetical protein